MRKMSRRKVAVAGVMAMMVLIIVLLVVPGLAANGATVVIDPPNSQCVVFDTDGPSDIAVPADKYKLISTNSTNANKTFQCEVWGVGNDTGAAINIDSGDFLTPEGVINYDCDVAYASGPIGDPDTIIITDTTPNWHQTISAAGDLKLTCQFNNNQL